uniref:FYVE-type domain-containing protein n=2 Tax=Mesocestoides corti TaxID=53468 RepID=A0A5K3F0Y4_MESCO
MRSCLLSGNVLEAVVAFHERSVRAQREEADYIHLDTSAVYSAVETSRKRLSRALLKLIETCVSETLRHQRQFRMKYTEDLNMESIEECLISAANKVLDVSASDRSLVAVRPIARTFLDTLARVQTQVDTVIETNNRYRKMLSKGRAKRLHIRRNSSVTKLPFFKRAVAESDSESEVATVATRAQHRDKQTLPSSASLPALPVAPNTDEFHRDSRDPKAEMRDLIGLLIEVDHDMAIFEFALISSVSRRLRSEAEAGEVQEVAVLFSETLMWARAVGLVDAQRLADRDPVLLVALPRLAVFAGCYLLPDGPIGPNRLNTGARPAFMFAESTKELTYLARQLSVLRADQLWRLACWTSPFGLSDAEAQCVDTAASLAKPPHRVQAGAVMKQCTLFGWNTYGLHCIYKSIAQVASRLSTNHPTELRYILQLAIELHDPPVEGGLGEPAADTEAAQEEEEEADRELQPICPLDSEVAAGCLHSGQIHGVNLADLFNWQRLVTASPDQRPPCKDLFKKKPATSRPSSADKGPGLSSIEHLFTPVEPPACEEVGVDVVASLATEADSTKLAEPSTTRSLFLSLFRSAPIENATPAAPANPLYPLALWQPDTYVGGAAASDTVEDDETNDGDDDTDSGGLGHGRWASGAARVGRDCVRCKARFVSLLRRRHHCRRCGHIFCAACCSERAPVAALIELGNIGATEGMPPTALVRVCVECAEFIRSGLGESLDQSILAL